MASRVGKPSPPDVAAQGDDLQTLGDTERAGRATDRKARQLLVHLRIACEVADADTIEIARGAALRLTGLDVRDRCTGARRSSPSGRPRSPRLVSSGEAFVGKAGVI